MGLTGKQEIPKKVEETKDGWTFRRLFPATAVSNVLSKTLVNTFDVLFVWLIFILSLAEIFGRRVSWYVWAFTLLIFLADLVERRAEPPSVEDDKKEKTKK